MAWWKWLVVGALVATMVSRKRQETPPRRALRERRGRRQQLPTAVTRIDAALEAKRQSIAALKTENAELRRDQEALLVKDTRRDTPTPARGGERGGRGGAAGRGRRRHHPRRGNNPFLPQGPQGPQGRPAAGGDTPKQQQPPVEGEPSEPQRRTGFATFYNAAARCVLAVSETAWVRCEREPEARESIQATFEVVASSTTVRLKAAGSGKFVAVVPPGEKEAWVLRESAGEANTSFELEDDGTSAIFLKNVGTGGRATVIRPERKASPEFKNAHRAWDVRGHGNRPHQRVPGGKAPLSKFEVRWLDEAEVAASRDRFTEAQRAEAERVTLEARRFEETKKKWASPHEKRVVAYGLYGSDPKYTRGAIRNSELVKTVFPGWVARFYCRDDVPPEVLATLRHNGAEVVDVGALNARAGNGIAGMFWRFLVADDPSVDRFIVRDADSRLNPRERAAVDEWIDSGKAVHSIRDHPNHDRPMNGGLWGGTKHCVPDISRKINDFSNRQSYGGDQIFLNTVVWPLVKHNQISHDAYTCFKYPNARPFPTKRPPNFQHVGQVFNANDEPRMGDINGFMRGRQVRPECRKEPDWKFG